jgi:cell division protein FtsX
MYRFSQWFILLPFLHGFISLSVSSAVPYSCLLSSICPAYADVALLFLMYRIYVSYIYDT